MTTTYASICPLIGGQTMGMQAAFAGKPEFFLSFPGFQNNDQHARAYYPDTPYYIIGEDVIPPLKSVDVISATCPCSGLSSLSPSASAESTTNNWMLESASYILDQLKPKVFWGENAPRLASKMGEPTVAKLRAIGKENGYTFSLIKTKSLLHGLPQVRERSFYFFWRGGHVPVFEYYDRERLTIGELIRDGGRHCQHASMAALTNKKKPTDDPWYRYVLQEMHGGISHPSFVSQLKLTTDPMNYIENNGVSYLDVAKWFRANGHEKQAVRAETVYAKLQSGGNIMRRGVTLVKDYIGAFVGHLPSSIAHPDHDRYLTIRECMDIMALPSNFELQGGLKNLNHICQNVPVTTARDMSYEIDKYLHGQLEMLNTDFAIQNNKTKTVEYINTQRTTLEEYYE